MKIWMLKSAVQQLIGILPKSYWWNRLLQKYINKSYFPSHAVFENKLNNCQRHLENYQKFNPTRKQNFTAMELGTGWWPIVPIGLYLSGAAEIWTFDITPNLQKDNLKRVLELFIEFYDSGKLEKILTQLNHERMKHLKSLFQQIKKESVFEFLKKININLSVGDNQISKLPDNSIDLIFSTVVFGHLDAEVLQNLLVEFNRVAKNDTISSHLAGIGDQYSSFDKSITIFNFYQYSDIKWKFLNNPLIPQGRLRVVDFREIFTKTGWTILEENNTTSSIDDLNKVKLAPKFQKYSTKDLLVTSFWMVAKPIRDLNAIFMLWLSDIYYLDIFYLEVIYL